MGTRCRQQDPQQAALRAVALNARQLIACRVPRRDRESQLVPKSLLANRSTDTTGGVFRFTPESRGRNQVSEARFKMHTLAVGNVDAGELPVVLR